MSLTAYGYPADMCHEFTQHRLGLHTSQLRSYAQVRAEPKSHVLSRISVHPELVRFVEHPRISIGSAKRQHDPPTRWNRDIADPVVVERSAIHVLRR